jgi:hypothetical protein
MIQKEEINSFLFLLGKLPDKPKQEGTWDPKKGKSKKKKASKEQDP